METSLHFTPATGWLNDPNGLIEHRGLHHFFFQHNPHELVMRDMCWGHASSPDLLTWTEHPLALTPGPAGSYDEGGCWSGCAVEAADGVVIVYSANKDGIQLPCLARALDDELITWRKDAANPVIDHRPPVDGMTDMRDHSVRWDGRQWRQVLAGGAAGEGMLLGYSSTDLVHWSWDGIVLRASDAGLIGQVWECPDVFELDGQVVAVISVMGRGRSPVIWVTGTLDGPRIVPLRWGLVDYGDRLYAPQSYSDHRGRRIMFGWLQTQRDPADLGQANLGVASLPRILSVVDGRLDQRPAVEIQARRGEAEKFSFVGGEATLAVPIAAVSALEVQLSCESGDDLLGLTVEFEDQAGHRLPVDLAVFSTPEPFLVPDERLPGRRAPLSTTIIFDAGIVEVFLDDGRAAALSDARLVDVGHLRITRAGAGPVDVTVWPLTAPAGTG
jgi:beta-fructofuranosidase